MSDIIKTLTDTITQRPQVGVFSSMAGIALSPVEMITLVSALMGLILAILTLTIKVIEIFERMHDRRLKIKHIKADQMTDGNGNTVLYVRGRKYIIAPEEPLDIITET